MQGKKLKKLVKLCHMCCQVTESEKEIQRCPKCNKSFLPLNYFEKIHSGEKKNFSELFENCEFIAEEDLIRGIHVLW